MKPGPSTQANLQKVDMKRIRSQPELDPFAQVGRQLGLDQAADFLGVVAGAEVGADDQLVLEAVGRPIRSFAVGTPTTSSSISGFSRST